MIDPRLVPGTSRTSLRVQWIFEGAERIFVDPDIWGLVVIVPGLDVEIERAVRIVGYGVRPFHAHLADLRARLNAVVYYCDAQGARRILDDVSGELHAIVVHQRDETSLLIVVHLARDDTRDNDPTLVRRTADGNIGIENLRRRARPLTDFDEIRERIRD